VIPNALVFLPGLDGTGALYIDLISALPPALDIVIARYPTDRFLSFPELVGLVKDLVPCNGSYVVVAESFSGPVGAKFAATRPPNLAGLIMCVGFVTNPSRRRRWLARAMATPLLFRLPTPSWVLEHFLIGTDPPRALVASVRKAQRLVKPAVLAKRIRAVLDCDAREDLAGTDIPMLYIQAEDDHLVGPECFQEIRSLRPDAALLVTPGPHALMERYPRKIADAIVQFIHQLS